jgi:hypothetical protein
MMSSTVITGFLVLAMYPSSGVSATIVGRSVPSPIYGVTLDNVGDRTAETKSLSRMAHPPTARIVFDTRVHPSYYLKPIKRFRNVAYVMGQLADSSYMSRYTVSSMTSWAQNYTTTLGTWSTFGRLATRLMAIG